jgi:hypothetical protein
MKPWNAIHIALLSCALPFAAFAQGVTSPDLSGNDPHWTHLEGQDCWAYSEKPAHGQHASWSGACTNRLASGPGQVTITTATGQLGSVATGTMVNGVLQGHALQDGHMPNGLHIIWEGELVNGNPEGPGRVLVYNANRLAFQFSGMFSSGKENGQGRGIIYNADGSVKQDFNGIWANGKPASPNTQPDVGLGIIASGSNASSATGAPPPVRNGSTVTQSPPRSTGTTAQHASADQSPGGDSVLKGLPMPNEHDSPCAAMGKVGFMVGKLKDAGVSMKQTDDIIRNRLVSMGWPSGNVDRSGTGSPVQHSSLYEYEKFEMDFGLTLVIASVYEATSSPDQARLLAYKMCRGGGQS